MNSATLKLKDRVGNQAGFSLIEILIVMALSLMILGSMIYTFTKQEGLLRDQNADTNMRALGRYAISRMAEDFRQVGGGVPALSRIETATATKFEFRSISKDNTNTPLEPGVVLAAVAQNDEEITVSNDSHFSAGQNVAIYDMDSLADASSSEYEIGKVVTSTSAGKVKFTATTKITTAAGFTEINTMINPYERIAYEYVAADKRIYRRVMIEDDDDPNYTVLSTTTTTLVDNVTACAFEYKNSGGTDTTDLGAIQKVKIDMTLQDPKETNAHISLDTEIYLRTTGL